MKDLITYTQDINELVAEGIEIAANPEHPAYGVFTVDEDGLGLTFSVTKVPVVYSNAGSTLSLVRGVSEALFDSVESVEVIGYYDAVSSSYVFYEGGQAKYEATYDVTPKEIDDGEGGTITYTPPYKFGVFA